MRVAYITAEAGIDPRTGRIVPGAATYHRATLPARALNALGHQATVVTRFGVNRNTGAIRPMVGGWGPADAGRFKGTLLDPPDVIVFVRWLDEHLPAIVQRARQAGQTVVFDVDDWLWGIPPSNRGHWALIHASPAHKQEMIRRGAPLAAYHTTQELKHLQKAMALTDLITTTNTYLADRLDRWRVPVAVLPNMVDVDAFAGPKPDLLRYGGRLRVGWTGANAYRAEDLETMRGLLGPWLERNRAMFVHLGHMPDATHIANLLHLSDSVPVETWPVVKPEDYPRAVRELDLDIGIIPLLDCPFNHAKSLAKALEYSAAGVPWIASAVGPYARRCPLPGAIARRPRDWLCHLDQLARADVRAFQAGSQYASVRQHDWRQQGHLWADTYREHMP